MITFKQIRYKNFLSAGNNFITIDLDKHKTTLFVGKNGAGKSVVLEAISFVLYNKTIRNINKPQLVNSINDKNLLCEIDFETGSHSYTVKRGIKPNVFEIFQNSVLLNQNSETKDYQKFLEERILGIGHKAFTQIVLLGARNFTPFMQLPALERRRIVEDLLDIRIFTVMNSILKERVNTNKSDLLDTQHKIDLLKAKIELHEKHLMSRNKDMDELQRQKQTKIDLYNAENIENEKLILSKQSEIEEVNVVLENRQKIEDALTKAKRIRQKHEKFIKDVDKNILFYTNNDSCPTCLQSIDSSFKQTTIAQHENEKGNIEKILEEIEAGYQKLVSRLNQTDDPTKEFLKLQEEILSLRTKINVTKRFIRDIRAELNTKPDDTSETDIAVSETDLKSATQNMEDLTRQRELLSAASILLKDGGIKTQVVRQYVPVMNRYINKYLDTLELFCTFEFDENFNEVIKSRYRDAYGYGSLSEGEKMRIDIALMFTWREIARIKNSAATNLLIMDEIFDSSMDSSGTDEFIKMINDLTSDTNTVIISHRQDQLSDKFDHVVHFKKVKNFTTIETIA